MNGATKVYYALTEGEAKKVFVDYNTKLGYKGVHLSLEGLRKFIKDHKIVDQKYYVEVPIAQFEVVPEIKMNPIYNMVAVKTPFTVIIKNVKTL